LQHNPNSEARAAPRTPGRHGSKKSPGPGKHIGEILGALTAQSPRKSTRTVATQMTAALGHLRPQQLTPLMTGALLAEWRQNLRPWTVWTYRNELRLLCAALQQFGAPTIQMPRLPRPKARAVTATPDELVKLFKDPPAWLRLFQFLYFQCGMRLAEALAVTPRSWNKEQRTVTVKVKGGAHRTVTITTDIENLLLSAGNPDPDEPFIFTLKGRSITARGLEAAWQTHRRKCGVNPALTPHDFRRTAASIIYPATKDLRAVQELLGHKSLTSTLSYIAPLHPDDARKYSELLRFEHFKSEVKQ